MLAIILLATAIQAEVDWAALRQDIVKVLPGGDEPFAHNGPFFVRLAWHCAGTYRAKDGRGGCDGGRLTMMPENGWRDNAGLPDALSVIRPIKEKYGDELSWGDLIVFAGSTAVEEMEGPKVKFCAGRKDDPNGDESLIFNAGRPEKHHDLIYVDPGQDGAAEVRETFNDMGFTDQETVAISGGGHAFGGCHASRSGFEGYWTKTPSKFTNDYFVQLLETQYEPSTSSVGNPQFTDVETHSLMMLKTDIAFATDPVYREWVEIYANDMDRLLEDFGAAWEKLMNRDMGDRPCSGPDYPKAEAATLPNVDFSVVKAELEAMPADTFSWGAMMWLAYKCAATYRTTDHRGGCNGARIRLEPEMMWGSNQGAGEALAVLEPIKAKYPDMSWADLIVLAGSVSVSKKLDTSVRYCAGRTDDADGARSELLNDGPLEDTTDSAVDFFKIMGLSTTETVALGLGLGSDDTTSFAKVLKVGEFQDEHKKLSGDEDLMKQHFTAAWSKLMSADMYGSCQTVAFSGKTEL